MRWWIIFLLISCTTYSPGSIEQLRIDVRKEYYEECMLAAQNIETSVIAASYICDDWARQTIQ